MQWKRKHLCIDQMSPSPPSPPASSSCVQKIPRHGKINMQPSAVLLMISVSFHFVFRKILTC